MDPTGIVTPDMLKCIEEVPEMSIVMFWYTPNRESTWECFRIEHNGAGDEEFG